LSESGRRYYELILKDEVIIMHAPKISKAKEFLDILKNKDKLIAEWELPYENLLTRLDAAIFFCNPVENIDEKELWQRLGSAFSGFEYVLNEEKKLSEMNYRLTFKDVKADETLPQ